MLTAKIISVGDELFKGTVNTTATTMARELSRLGIEITRIVTAPDKLADISSEIKQSKKTDILIITGGLGPTDDDATVAAVAHAFGVQVTVDPTHLVYLKSIQTRRNLPVQFLKQAEIPKGFSAKKSDFGSAPFIYRLKSKKTNLPIFSIPLVVLLPGVPYECLGLFEQEVLPLIKKLPENYTKEKPSSANPVVMLELKIIGVAVSGGKYLKKYSG